MDLEESEDIAIEKIRVAFEQLSDLQLYPVTGEHELPRYLSARVDELQRKYDVQQHQIRELQLLQRTQANTGLQTRTPEMLVTDVRFKQLQESINEINHRLAERRPHTASPFEQGRPEHAQPFGSPSPNRSYDTVPAAQTPNRALNPVPVMHAPSALPNGHFRSDANHAPNSFDNQRPLGQPLPQHQVEFQPTNHQIPATHHGPRPMQPPVEFNPRPENRQQVPFNGPPPVNVPHGNSFSEAGSSSQQETEMLRRQIHDLLQRIHKLEHDAQSNSYRPRFGVERAAYIEDAGDYHDGNTLSPLWDTEVSNTGSLQPWNPQEDDSVPAAKLVPRVDDGVTYHNWLTIQYDISDLLTIENFDLNSVPIDADIKQQYEEMLQDRVEQIIESIQSAVEPYSWINNKIARIRFNRRHMNLLITQTYSNHREIETVLQKARDGQIQLFTNDDQ
ncbi:MAG TPA: hypothetical protein PKD64_14620 [Pirellulaceae bacterium]|nr:hypothetical protein [Pirellulaceae bacterium]HMO93416.1 hypothetical protein [Pirellulaceae bacterium]HMP70460.1 hypothetical protein [Pirellulaceae bacterium]